MKQHRSPEKKQPIKGVPTLDQQAPVNLQSIGGKGMGLPLVEEVQVAEPTLLQMAEVLYDQMPRTVAEALGPEQEARSSEAMGFGDSECHDVVAGWDFGQVVREGSRRSDDLDDGKSDWLQMLTGELPTRARVTIAFDAHDTEVLSAPGALELGQSSRVDRMQKHSDTGTASLGASGKRGEATGTAGLEASQSSEATEGLQQGTTSKLAVQGVLMRSVLDAKLTVEMTVAGATINSRVGVASAVGTALHKGVL